MAYLIEIDEPAGAGVRRVLEEQRALILSELSRWEEDPALAIHRARQACKRARAVAQLLKVASPYAATVENQFFRGIQQGVAYARDDEALVEVLASLLAGVSEPRLKESVTMLRDSCAARATRNLRVNHATLGVQIDRACEQLRDAGRRLARLPVDDLRRRDLKRGARRTWKRCVSGFLELGPESPSAAFHDWRRQAKYAYNQTRVLAASCPPGIEAPLKELAATLGECQDLELLECFLREQPDALNIDTHVQRLHRLIGESRHRLRGQSLEIGRRLFLPDSPAPEAGQEHPGSELSNSATVSQSRASH